MESVLARKILRPKAEDLQKGGQQIYFISLVDQIIFRPLHRREQVVVRIQRADPQKHRAVVAAELSVYAGVLR